MTTGLGVDVDPVPGSSGGGDEELVEDSLGTGTGIIFFLWLCSGCCPEVPDPWRVSALMKVMSLPVLVGDKVGLRGHLSDEVGSSGQSKPSPGCWGGGPLGSPALGPL